MLTLEVKTLQGFSDFDGTERDFAPASTRQKIFERVPPTKGVIQ